MLLENRQGYRTTSRSFGQTPSAPKSASKPAPAQESFPASAFKRAQRLLIFALMTTIPFQSHASVASAHPLSITVYNPGTASVFPVSSEIITGPRDAILIDAQFQTNDAHHLVDIIRATHKHLQAIYISHSDPDYYFGLGVLHRAFPDVKILATPETVAAIRVLKDRKLKYWGPILGKYAPGSLIVPEALHADRLMLDGHRILIEGLHGPTPARTFVYIPSLRTVAGGAVVFSGTHVWIADSKTVQDRANWMITLRSILALKPLRVIPGHYLGAAPKGVGAVLFTRDYLIRFDQERQQHPKTADLIAAMEAAYPKLPERTWLELSVRVVNGEYKWPQ